MGTFVILAVVGFWLGLRIHSRLGALLLSLSAAVSMDAVLQALPRMVHNSAYGRRFDGLLVYLNDGDGLSMFRLMAYAVIGLSIALMLHGVSVDRQASKPAPSRRKRRKARPVPNLRHDPC